MPRLPDVIIPKYRHHRPSGQAVVTLNGRDFYLGNHGSAASKAEYDRRIAEWIAAGRRQRVDPGLITVGEIVLAFLKHARGYYRQPDGTPTAEVGRIMRELKPMTRLYHHTPAGEFDSLRLAAVREAMITEGWSRTSVNHAISTIKRCFKFAAGRKMIDAAVFRDLETLEALKAGRSEAAEPRKVKPVPIARVDAVIAAVHPTVGAMIRLQLLTGMRSTELCTMRGMDIEMGGRVFLYKPAHHKTEHHGHDRLVYLGPKAQAIIRPFLKRGVQAYLFSPAEAVEAHLEERHAKRKTPMSCGNKPGVRRREFNNQYTKDSYARAITRGCDRAFPPPRELAQLEGESQTQWMARLTTDQMKALETWRRQHRWHPHQLRHNFATAVRKDHGAEAALVMLGDRSTRMVDLYAEKNSELAVKIMEQTG